MCTIGKIRFSCTPQGEEELLNNSMQVSPMHYAAATTLTVTVSLAHATVITLVVTVSFSHAL